MCEGITAGTRCLNPTASTSLGQRMRCEACAPGESHTCMDCGARNLDNSLTRLRHRFRVHGEERTPFRSTMSGFVVLADVYVDGKTRRVRYQGGPSFRTQGASAQVREVSQNFRSKHRQLDCSVRCLFSAPHAKAPPAECQRFSDTPSWHQRKRPGQLS